LVLTEHKNSNDNNDNNTTDKSTIKLPDLPKIVDDDERKVFDIYVDFFRLRIPGLQINSMTVTGCPNIYV